MRDLCAKLHGLLQATKALDVLASLALRFCLVLLF